MRGNKDEIKDPSMPVKLKKSTIERLRRLDQGYGETVDGLVRKALDVLEFLNLQAKKNLS